MHAWLVCAAAHGFVAVAIGAFAAHGLEGAVAADRLGWIDTGARYQMVHALALLGLTAAAAAWGLGRRRSFRIAAWAFSIGAVLFPGGLYLAGMLGWTWLMPIVPVGGGAFLLGWLAAAVLGSAVGRSGHRTATPAASDSG